MSELKVQTIESNNTLTANSLFAGNLVINSTGITAPTYTVNTSAIKIGNSTVDNIITANSSVDFVILNSATEIFPNPTDIYAWAGSASFNNSTGSRDYTIEISPAKGIPFKVTPTGTDPFPATYNGPTWNLAATDPGDVWKISGYARSDGNITLTPGQFILNLLANSTGLYGTAGGTNSQIGAITFIGNTWTYFEKFVAVIGNANTAYIQLRLDGPDSGLNDFWYDGLSLKKAIANTATTETVNTQIFTANGTWTKPSWATDGRELVIVHMWGGGGGSAGGVGSSGGSGGGGGAFAFGYFITSNLSSTEAVVVGGGGAGQAAASGVTIQGGAGGNSSFANLVAFGGGGGTYNSTLSPAYSAGGGGGWLRVGSNTAGGGPLGGTSASTDSTFGGGVGAVGFSPAVDGGNSIYGGGGGAASALTPSTFSRTPGNSIFGGGGGGTVTLAGSSIYGGSGGNRADGNIPGGGGGTGPNGYAGARGEVRVYTLRIR